MKLPWPALLQIAFATCAATSALAAERFGRPLIDIAEPNQYQHVTVDEIDCPILVDDSLAVGCLVYRGTANYYVELRLANLSSSALQIDSMDVAFDKPGYTILRLANVAVARDISSEVSGSFVPTPLSQNTNEDPLVKGFSDLGTSLSNAYARRRFEDNQAESRNFARFLTFTDSENCPPLLQGGAWVLTTYVFSQIKPSGAPFTVQLSVAGRLYAFGYKE